MPIKLKRYILLFIPFFMLLYSENINIGGGMKISQLWKMPLLAYLIYYVFQYRRKSSPDWTKMAVVEAFDKWRDVQKPCQQHTGWAHFLVFAFVLQLFSE